MANSDKDIKITPNTGSANLPKIEFTGQDNATKTLSVANSGALSFDGDLTVTGDFTVSGSTTSVNTETITIDDNIIVLNNNQTGTPSENAGIEVERGDSTNTVLRWNETTDRWQFTNDGTNYHNIPTSSEYTDNDGDITGVNISAGTGISVSQSNTGSGDYTATITNSAPNVAFAVGDITGATALTSGLASTDELVLSDGGVLKRMDISVIENYMQNNLTFTTNTDTQLTQEQVEDYVAGVITAGTNVTATYDDSAGTLTIASTDTNTQLSDSQVETAYNTQVSQVSSAERTNGTATGIRRYAPADIKSMIDTHQSDTVYTHPTHDGDDISIDTGALTGATVISDLDFNVTTDTLGHVTDANATVSTRNLTLANLGFTGDSDATDDQTASEITALLNDVASYSLGTADTGTITVNHDLTVTGDLIVSGDTVTLNTATLDVEDVTIRVAKDASTLSATDGAGIEFGADSSKPTLTWDNTNTRLTTNKAFHSSGGFIGSITGDVTGTASNASAIDDGAVSTAAKLASNVVTEAKINSNAVTNTKIAAGAVDTNELAADAVEEAKIANSAVTGAKISAFAIADKSLSSILYQTAGETGNILVNSNNGFPDEGVVSLEDELIRYKGINGDGRTLNNCTRGYRGTTATGHTANGSLTVTLLAGKEVTLGGTKKVEVIPFVGSDGTNASETGLVPATAAGDNNKYLRGDGSWQTISSGTTPNDSTVTLTAGNGLTGGGTFTTDQSSNSSVSFAVGVDDSSIEINSDALRVKASGITNAMLGGSIANAKLANSAITVDGTSVSLGGSVTTTNTNQLTTFTLTGDSGTNQTIAHGNTLDIAGGTGISTTVGDTDTVTVAIDAAQTGITSLLATDIKIGEDDQTKIDFEDADTINFYAGNEKQLILTDGALTTTSTFSIDTASAGGSIRIKNGGNEVGRLMQYGFQAIDGTATNPSIMFLNSYQTGLYRAAANQIGFTINGTGQVIIKDGVIEPVTDNDVDLGSSSLEFKDGYFDGTLHCDVLDLAGTEYTSIGGASVLSELTDVTMDATNFTDSLLIQINSDGSAPTTGTLNSASDNIGIGKDVFAALTSGHSSVVLGAEAGKSLTSGHESVLIGHNAGKLLTYASDNVAIGAYALDAATSGGSNVAVGYYALSSVTGSNSNVAIGYNAGKTVSNQTNNTLVGRSAGQDLNSANNVIIGSMAGDGISSGGNQTLIGYSAGGGLTTGSDNITIGYYAGSTLTTGSGNVVIGRSTPDSNTGDNQLIISNSKQTSFGGRTWILGNDDSQVNSKVNVIAVSSNTTLTNVGEGVIAQSGAVIYWTGGTLTLPYNATVGTQYTIINNTGSAAKPDLNSNGDFLNGTHGNIDDKDSRTYICVASGNTSGGSPDWWGIG